MPSKGEAGLVLWERILKGDGTSFRIKYPESKKETEKKENLSDFQNPFGFVVWGYPDRHANDFMDK